MPEEYETYLNTIYSYPHLFEKAYKESKNVDLPSDLSNITDIVIAGMGGSAFGAYVLKDAFSNETLLNPVEIVNRYDLPSYADETTLVIASSYSGNTEETLSIFDQAISKGCKVVVISTGGKLIDLAKEKSIPHYQVVETQYNPTHTPRLGMASNIGSILGILSKLGLVVYGDEKAKETADYMKSFVEIIKVEDRMPVQIAQKLVGKTPVFMASEHLVAPTHIWKNFLNETSKHISFMHEIPEMNHHLLDGLLHPNNNREQLIFVFVNSELYNDRNKSRIKVSREVIKRHGFQDISISVGAGNRLNEIFELIIIGCLVSYNLAKIHAANPTTNEFVDYLKENI